MHQLIPDCGHPAIQSDVSADRERTCRVHSVISSAVLVVVVDKLKCPYGGFYVAYCVVIVMEPDQIEGWWFDRVDTA